MLAREDVEDDGEPEHTVHLHKREAVESKATRKTPPKDVKVNIDRHEETVFSPLISSRKRRESYLLISVTSPQLLVQTTAGLQSAAIHPDLDMMRWYSSLLPLWCKLEYFCVLSI